jgi:hypothetical protein
MDKDVLDSLCATDPHWASALQILQLARQQSGGDPVRASAQLVCAIVLLANETPKPHEFLKLCADSLRKTPMKGARDGAPEQ